jgi:hypothetical protein
VIAFIRDHPDDYEPGFEEVFVKLRPGLNFILRVGWDIFPFRGAVGP